MVINTFDQKSDSLQGLFAAIAHAKDENTLRKTVMTQLGSYFCANRWGLFFSDDFSAFTQNRSPLARLAVSLDYNPVLRYLVNRHAAVHDEVVLPPGLWKTLCPRADHGHVLTGPLIEQGQLIGGVGFTRHRDSDAFNADDLADLNALCLHLSGQLTMLRRSHASAHHTSGDCLTPREKEIAALVADGLTNKKIGAALWITENSVKQALKRMYRKLSVSSRAEMVAKLR